MRIDEPEQRGRLGVNSAGEIRPPPPQDLIRPPQLTVFPLQLRDPHLILCRGTRPRPVIDLGLLHPAAQRLGVNAQLAAHPGQLTLAPAVTGPDLQDHLYRALAQLIGVLPLCRHDSASSQGSEPPRSPGRSNHHPVLRRGALDLQAVTLTRRGSVYTPSNTATKHAPPNAWGIPR